MLKELLHCAKPGSYLKTLGAKNHSLVRTTNIAVSRKLIDKIVGNEISLRLACPTSVFDILVAEPGLKKKSLKQKLP